MNKATKKLNILLVEDNPASIKSARMQFKGCDFIIARTCCQALEAIGGPFERKMEKFDLILADVNIPLGDERGYSVMKLFGPETQWPAGLIVAMRAIGAGKPCILLTDANGHKNVIGMLIEQMLGGGVQSGRDQDWKLFVATDTRPDWIETRFGKGKNWLRSGCAREAADQGGVFSCLKEWMSDGS